MTAERITAPHVQKALDEHLQKHELKIDPKLHDVYHAVLGEQGKGGLCDEVDKIKSDLSAADARFERVCNDISAINDTLKWISRLVIGAVIMAILGLIFIP
jgi:hypothetical protein